MWHDCERFERRQKPGCPHSSSDAEHFPVRGYDRSSDVRQTELFERRGRSEHDIGRTGRRPQTEDVQVRGMEMPDGYARAFWIACVPCVLSRRERPGPLDAIRTLQPDKDIAGWVTNSAVSM